MKDKDPHSSGGKMAFYTERSLAIACTRGREAIVKRFQSLLAGEGFTEQQWRVLRVLYDFEPLQLGDLCRLCCIHKVSMTRIVRALSERNLVVREQQEDDRRAYNVRLTPEGRALLDRMTPVANDIYRQISSEFGEDKTRQLLQLLKELAQINSR